MTVASVWVPDPYFHGINREVLSMKKSYKAGSPSVTMLHSFKSQRFFFSKAKYPSVYSQWLQTTDLKNILKHMLWPHVVGVLISQIVGHLALSRAIVGRCWGRWGAERGHQWLELMLLKHHFICSLFSIYDHIYDHRITSPTGEHPWLKDDFLQFC